MASYKFLLFVGNKRADGSFPVSLRITKDRKAKFIRTGLEATSDQWSKESERFVNDKKLVPEYKMLNSRLSELEVRMNEIMRNFEIDRIDWTLNQFENAFLNHTRKGKVYDYVEDLVTVLVETNHIGNANCYKATLHMLELFDKS